MAGLPPKPTITPGPAEARLKGMLKDQQTALTARLRTPPSAWANVSMRGQELSARAMGVRSTADLAKQAKAEFSDAIKTKGIANPMTRRANVSIGGKTRRATKSGGDIVTHLLTIRNQIKLYHWQTKQFARHTATDALTTALDLNIDAFVESYMGRYGRPSVSGSIKLHNFSESAAKSFVAKETKYLETELPKKIGKGDTDLLNLRDTILGDLTKVSYLFTLQKVPIAAKMGFCPILPEVTNLITR